MKSKTDELPPDEAWAAVRDQVFRRGPVYINDLMDKFNRTRTAEHSEAFMDHLDVWEKAFCRNLILAALSRMNGEIHETITASRSDP